MRILSSCAALYRRDLCFHRLACKLGYFSPRYGGVFYFASPCKAPHPSRMLVSNFTAQSSHSFYNVDGPDLSSKEEYVTLSENTDKFDLKSRKNRKRRGIKGGTPLGRNSELETSTVQRDFSGRRFSGREALVIAELDEESPKKRRMGADLDSLRKLEAAEKHVEDLQNQYSSFFWHGAGVEINKSAGRKSKARFPDALHSDELSNSLNNSRRHRRISPKNYWYGPRNSASDLPSIDNARSIALKVIIMNEARRVRKGHPVDLDIWNKIEGRAVKLSENASPRTLLRFLQAFASAKVPGIDAYLKALILCLSRDLQLLEPKHFVFLVQALSRLQWRDKFLIVGMKQISLSWPTLRNNFLIKAANAISKLDLASHTFSKPLQMTLASRMHDFTAKDCGMVKWITAIELFTREMLVSYLIKCEHYSEHFATYGRGLHILELHIRLEDRFTYSQLPESTRAFLEIYRGYLRNNTVLPKSDESNKVAKVTWNSSLHRDVSRVLGTLMQIQHLNAAYSGPFILDILFPSIMVTIDLMCPFHYYQHTRHQTSTSRRRQQLLQSMGFTLLKVPFFDWESQKSDDAKVMFLRSLLNKSK